MSAVEAFSVASVEEDDGNNEINGDHGRGGIDLDSRRAEEAASRSNEAASWIKNMVGIVATRDLPAEPSEEELRLALRTGMILCTVLNRVKPGAVPKARLVLSDLEVVESPHDCNLVPDGALSAYQYFENVRNFLVAAQEIGVPTFEASDLEQGGISVRIVNSILALKSYHEWRQSTGNGVWKFGSNVKPTVWMKQFVRKNSEPFSNSYSRKVTFKKKSSTPSHDAEPNNTCSSQSLRKLVHSLLADKRQEEVPQLVDSILMKVVKESENSMSTIENIDEGNITIKRHLRSMEKDTSASTFSKSFAHQHHKNSSQNGLNVPNANVFPVSLTSEVLTLMNLGQRSRAVGATALNDRSSRSSQLLDCSRSERVDKSEVTRERLKEAQHINKSLSALGDVIASLAQKNSHVPCRSSKLTQLLQDSLGGQAKTLMFVHISLESDALGETISTVKFAERVASVKLGAAPGQQREC
ncbi:Kinesin-like protein [Drosera capensis]